MTGSPDVVAGEVDRLKLKEALPVTRGRQIRDVVVREVHVSNEVAELSQWKFCQEVFCVKAWRQRWWWIVTDEQKQEV